MFERRKRGTGVRIQAPQLLVGDTGDVDEERPQLRTDRRIAEGRPEVLVEAQRFIPRLGPLVDDDGDDPGKQRRLSRNRACPDFTHVAVELKDGVMVSPGFVLEEDIDQKGRARERGFEKQVGIEVGELGFDEGFFGNVQVAEGRTVWLPLRQGETEELGGSCRIAEGELEEAVVPIGHHKE